VDGRSHVDAALIEASSEADDPTVIIEEHVDLGTGPYVLARLRLVGAIGEGHACRTLTSSWNKSRRGHVIGHRADVHRTLGLFDALSLDAVAARDCRAAG
jgi:hypothetical protein